MSTSSQELRSYRFGPLDRKGLIAGMRTGQVIIGGGSVLVAAMSVASLELGNGLTVAIFTLTFGAAALFVVPGGRGVDEWLPVVAKWFSMKIRGRHKWLSSMPLLGTVETNSTNESKLFNLPDSLAGLSILEAPLDETNAHVGVIKDKRYGTFTGILSVRGTAFALLDAAEKERRLASWGDVLAGLARQGSVAHRVQWIERSVPDDGDGLNRYLSEARTEPEDSNLVHSYVDLLEEYGPSTQQHEIFIVIQINAAKGSAGRAIRKAGGGDAGAARVLVRELKQLAFRLGEADVRVEGALTPRLVARAIRTSVDPGAGRLLARRARLHGDEGCAPDNAWPLATETSWSYYRTENAYHATYWIAEWPRLEVGTDFLAPLMLRSTRIRSISLTMEPVDPTQATREIQSQHTSYVADEELRARAGYMASKRRQTEIEAIERREAELAAGYSEYRMSGFVTVTAFSLDELDEACTDIEQAAQQSRLELRRLYGEQDFAFTSTLPLCRGIK